MATFPSPFRQAQRIRSHGYALAFVAAYAVTTGIAYTWTVGSGGLAVLWPCNGMLAAALLLLRRRDAIVTALACVLLDGLGAYALGHSPAPRAALIASCDLFEAFAAATLMRRFCGAAVDLTSARRLLSMILFAAAPATLLVGTVGALLTHLLFGDPIGLLWLTWAGGDMLGMLVGAPAALIMARAPRYLRDQTAPTGESLAIVLGLSVIAAGQLLIPGQHDAFLIFPFMLLAAFRISAPYSVLAMVLVSAITAGVTIDGHGPFAEAQVGPRTSILGLQLFMACVALSTLIAQGWLTSLARARRRAARALAAARQTAARAQENAARLTESEGRYRILAENTSDIIQRVDVDYIIRYVSPSIRQLGYAPEDLIGREAISIVHPDHQEEILRRRGDLLVGKLAPTWELRTVSASGDAAWMESNVAPILDESGAVTGVVNILRNITERKAAEAALRQLNAELQRVARVSALGAFATSLGHEINQPLAAIVTNSEASLRWLSRDPPDVQQAVNAIERTRRDALRSSQIVARLRSLVTKEAPSQIEFDVREAVREVLDLAESRRIQASVRLTQALGRQPRRVLGDKIQLQQVIMNLVLNAIEAMQEVPADERRLTVAIKAHAGDGVEIVIEDTGPGVGPELRQKIFDNLFTTKLGGTGLGLPISRTIVEAHGGTLEIDDIDPRGAAFRVWLPRDGQTQAHHEIGESGPGPADAADQRSD